MKLRTLEKRLAEHMNKVTNLELRASVLMARAGKLRGQAGNIQNAIDKIRQQRRTQ